MEYSNIAFKSIQSMKKAVQIEQEILEMPNSPCLKPRDVSLETYLEMGIFYLQQTDEQSCQSHISIKSIQKKKKISKKHSRKQRKNTNATQIDQYEKNIV